MQKPLFLQLIQWLVAGWFGMLAGHNPVAAQSRPDSTQYVLVKGTVDSSYRPRAGVMVLARQSGKTTRTDAFGQFNLLILRTDTLLFKYADMPVRAYALVQLTGDVDLSYDLSAGKGEYIVLTTDRGEPKTVDENVLPQFPWPVPKPSTKWVLDDRFFAKAHTLSQVNQQLSDALRKSQYPNSAYYLIPNGFALVSQIEQIEPDGTPKPLPDRWSLKVNPLQTFTLSNYLRLLFTAATGHFRVVVFLVTNATNQSNTPEPDIKIVKDWVNGGGDFLPDVVGKQPYGTDYHVTALIYEFQKPENGQARPVSPSKAPGQEHLTKSNFMANLSR